MAARLRWQGSPRPEKKEKSEPFPWGGSLEIQEERGRQGRVGTQILAMASTSGKREQMTVGLMKYYASGGRVIGSRAESDGCFSTEPRTDAKMRGVVWTPYWGAGV